jgi:hypothetical protein
MRNALITATETAIRTVDAPRFFRTERGFQGRFYSSLLAELEHAGLLVGGAILEMEYQKRGPHGTAQRPDIIFHIPFEHSGADRTANNFAVWALKRRATVASAQDDFDKLDQMFSGLQYPLGFFVNIDSTCHMAEHYNGGFPTRLVAVAASLDGTHASTHWAATPAEA